MLCWRCMQLYRTGADTLFGCCRRLDDAHESGGHSHSFAWAERHDGGNRIAGRLPSRRFAGENVRTSPLRCKYGLCLVAPRLIDCAARMDSAEEGRNLGRSFAEQADEDMHEETHKPTISVTLTHGKVRILFPPKPSVLPWDRVCSRCAGLGAGADAEEGALETTSAARHAAGSIWPLHVSPTRECALWVSFFWH